MAINSITGNSSLQSGSFLPARVASSGSPLTPSTGGLLVVDGVQLVAGDRVLCKDETNAVNNGIYAANTGPWVRTTDASSNTQFFSGMTVTIGLGSVNAGLTYLCTCQDDPVVVGTSLITFASQAGVASGQQSATSTTSLTIGTGSKTLTIQSGKAFLANQWLVIFETTAPTNSMLAQVTSYTGTSLVANVTATGGAGTHTDWTVVLLNSAAAAGISPPVGSGNVTGPGSSTTGHIATFADGTGKVLLDGGAPVGAANTITPSMLAVAAAGMGANMLNGVIKVTASAGALQCAVKTLASGGANDPSPSDPVFFLSRSATGSSGTLLIIEATSALALTSASEILSTAGFSTNTPGRLWFVAYNNAGSIGLAAINCLGNSGVTGASIYPLAGQGIASISAMGTSGSTSNKTFYGQGSVASVPYSVIGYATWEAPVTMTAGTWINPSFVETYRPGVPLPGETVQPLYMSTASTQTISSATPAASNMSQPITLTSTANVVKAAASTWDNPAASASTLSIRINRVVSGTPVPIGQPIQGGGTSAVELAISCGPVLDGPASTSWAASMTYTVYVAGNGANNVTVENGTLLVEELMA
jgi:hypothetical protein